MVLLHIHTVDIQCLLLVGHFKYLNDTSPYPFNFCSSPCPTLLYTSSLKKVTIVGCALYGTLEGVYPSGLGGGGGFKTFCEIKLNYRTAEMSSCSDLLFILVRLQKGFCHCKSHPGCGCLKLHSSLFIVTITNYFLGLFWVQSAVIQCMSVDRSQGFGMHIHAALPSKHKS